MINTKKLGAVVTTIITAAVGLILIANLLPTFFPAVADVNSVLSDPTTTVGDPVGDALLPVFTIVIGVVALLAVINWAMGALGVKFGGRS